MHVAIMLTLVFTVSTAMLLELRLTWSIALCTNSVQVQPYTFRSFFCILLTHSFFFSQTVSITPIALFDFIFCRFMYTIKRSINSLSCLSNFSIVPAARSIRDISTHRRSSCTVRDFIYTGCFSASSALQFGFVTVKTGAGDILW